jgi:hypothetical protein
MSQSELWFAETDVKIEINQDERIKWNKKYVRRRWKGWFI